MAGQSALALLAAAGLFSAPAEPLPPEALAIALRVAAPGLPGCTAHHPDGTTGPCLPHFTLRPGRAVNGWSLAGRIAFTRGAAERLDPHAFALLAGHEIAHWYLGHTGSSPEAELAADRLGAELACRAGYDPQRGAVLFRFLRGSPRHPAPALRQQAVLALPCPR